MDEKHPRTRSALALFSLNLHSTTAGTCAGSRCSMIRRDDCSNARTGVTWSGGVSDGEGRLGQDGRGACGGGGVGGGAGGVVFDTVAGGNAPYAPSCAPSASRLRVNASVAVTPQRVWGQTPVFGKTRESSLVAKS